MAPRAIIAILWGKLEGVKAVLEPGASLRVGRTDLADLPIRHDLQMASVHFEISWDGARCTLRDLGSAGGTLLGGNPVREAVVPHGAWIRAGETDFSLHVEGHTPPRRSRRVDPEAQARAAAADRALHALRMEAEAAPLYAVLDAARDDRILELCREAVEEHRSLYEGPRGDALGEVAPYLVRMSPGSRLLEALVREGWGRRWGIYFTCRRTPKEVRTHLRHFLMVQDDTTGARLYFRFYDPAVLRVFLPACTVRQAADLSGEIDLFLVEDDDLSVRRLDPGATRGAAPEGRGRVQGA